MTGAHETPDLSDVLEPHEEVHPDHREHAKAAPHPDDDELARRTEQEREQVARDRDAPRSGD